MTKTKTKKKFVMAHNKKQEKHVVHEPNVPFCHELQFSTTGEEEK
jgi:hypothetical protein